MYKILIAIAKKCYPDYRGRKFRINQKGSVTFYNTNWGGGTRNSYAGVNYQNGKYEPLADFSPWYNPAEGKTIAIPQGYAVIEHSIFCGKDCGLTIHLCNRDTPTQITGGQK